MFLVGTGAAWAQVGGGASAVSGSQRMSGRVGFPGVSVPAAQITGAPFSGVRETEHTQTLTDGTHISQKMMVQKVWRDTDGRMRTERPMGPNALEGTPVVVEITDPVAGYRYTLDTQGKIAHRVAIAQRLVAPPLQPGRNQSRTGPARQGNFSASLPDGVSTATFSGGGIVSYSGAAARPRVQSQHESLGTKTIDGVLVEGTRSTHTTPEGAQGNDRPISTVIETWYSSELREMIESTSSDPRSGENITRLTNIDRNNPDPSLFQVPDDYEIVDEKGPFSINYHSN